MTTAPTRPADAAGPGSGFGRFVALILSDREQFYGEVAEGEGLAPKLIYSLGTLLALCALYGAAAGAYAGPVQALSAAIKLPLLFLGTLAICFPGFCVIQVLVGSRLRLAQVLALVLGALSLSAIVLAAVVPGTAFFLLTGADHHLLTLLHRVLVLGALSLSAIVLAAVVPVTAFFLLTGANYYFLTLLHVVLVLGAGLVGMAVLHEGLAFACEKRGVDPKTAMTIMKVWAGLFAFVGIQMAWNLQPFVGDRGQPFQLFRHSEGNFYTAIIYSLQKLSHGEGKPVDDSPVPHVDERDLFELGKPPVSDSTHAPGR